MMVLKTPPIAGEVDYIPFNPHECTPKFYNVTKINQAGKSMKRIVKFSTTSLLNIDGDMAIVNGNV